MITHACRWERERMRMEEEWSPGADPQMLLLHLLYAIKIGITIIIVLSLLWAPRSLWSIFTYTHTHRSTFCCCCCHTFHFIALRQCQMKGKLHCFVWPIIIYQCVSLSLRFRLCPSVYILKNSVQTHSLVNPFLLSEECTTMCSCVVERLMRMNFLISWMTFLYHTLISAFYVFIFLFLSLRLFRRQVFCRFFCVNLHLYSLALFPSAWWLSC